MKANQCHAGVSIVIPTYQEAKNLPDLMRQIESVDFEGRSFEVLLVDDNSQDGTDLLVKQWSVIYPWLKLIVRHHGRDLSGAVIEGIQQSSYACIVTMDADGSHPAKKIPALLALLDNPETSLVIGSRYVKGGGTDREWPLMRRWTSKLAALLARGLLGVKARDPLSGFLAIRKATVLSGQPLKPIGWKIGLEIMIKCGCQEIREVPIYFSERRHGKSKLNANVLFDYLRHVMVLMWFQWAQSSRREQG